MIIVYISMPLGCTLLARRRDTITDAPLSNQGSTQACGDSPFARVCRDWPRGGANDAENLRYVGQVAFRNQGPANSQTSADVARGQTDSASDGSDRPNLARLRPLQVLAEFGQYGL